LGREDQIERSEVITDRMIVVVFNTESKTQGGKRLLLQLENEGSIVVHLYAV
jgi:hypothetical protein